MDPVTETGRTLLAFYHNAMHGDDCDCAATFIRDPIIAIEQEAASKAVAEVLDRLEKRASLSDWDTTADRSYIAALIASERGTP